MTNYDKVLKRISEATEVVIYMDGGLPFLNEICIHTAYTTSEVYFYTPNLMVTVDFTDQEKENLATHFQAKVKQINDNKREEALKLL